ncbi:MAG: cytochrome c biogenesis protein CcdA [Chloroflexi bacterium]|nr:MAG: cytochrome c biogenesis protein CcdA [Chloroflexota bacterium]
MPYASTFGIPAIFVILLLGVLLGLRDSAETFMANLANLLPVGYAFGAGMVASVNPCGFFMLPSYISYHLGTEEAEFEHLPTITRLRKALLLGSIVTLGFISVFSVVGSFIAAGGQWLVTVFPYAGVAIGVIIVLLGIWLLVSQRTLGILAASRVAVSQNRSHWNVFLFGVVYAIGSLSCTLPIFLVVVGGSLASSGISTSIGQFISYALGMGMILVLVTIGSALFQDSVAKWLRRAIPYVHRASAMFLVGAGAYLIYYWVFFVGLSF